jgi:hypothetical protein
MQPFLTAAAAAAVCCSTSSCRLVVLEFKLQRFIVRDPEKSLGVFAGTWWDLSDDQREAAGVLGYSNDSDSVRCAAML